MNNDCNIVRDLMPLYIDGVASEESKQYIEAHIKQCAQCKTYLEGMRAALPAAPKKRGAEEEAAFDHAADMLKKKHRRRVWRNVLIGILIGVLVMVGGYVGWTELAVKYNAELPVDAYGVFLTQLANGKVIVSIDYQGSKRIMGTVIRDTEEADSEHPDGLRTLRIWMETTIIPQTMIAANRNGPTTVIDDIDQLDVICVGEHSDTILWRKGDSIAQASDAMEAYYAADDLRWDYFMEWNRAQNNGAIGEDAQEINDTLDSMSETVQHLRLAVPEWQ
ncbi:MAG TPA: zf-HC2 domain-containing protein [Candidatus Limiplasma sp.]|nr:zf-HC2 domain-containing protein [Candidatus Limiplasma sp.]